MAGLDARRRPGDFDVPERRAIVFQEHRLLPWSRVWRNVTLGLAGGDLRSRALAALERGRPHRTGRRLAADPLRRRVAAGGAGPGAGALRPQLLLLDEPFGALDALTRLKAQALVARLWAEHRPAVLLVTHDVEEALLLADRCLLLETGAIAAEFDVDVPRPRRPRPPPARQLRPELLLGLGVDPDPPHRRPRPRGGAR